MLTQIQENLVITTTLERLMVKSWFFVVCGFRVDFIKSFLVKN